MDIDACTLVDELNVASSGIQRLSNREVKTLTTDQIERLEAAAKNAGLRHRVYAGVLVEPAFEVRPESYLCKAR